jgi:hypothetical protein
VGVCRRVEHVGEKDALVTGPVGRWPAGCPRSRTLLADVAADRRIHGGTSPRRRATNRSRRTIRMSTRVVASTSAGGKTVVPSRWQVTASTTVSSSTASSRVGSSSSWSKSRANARWWFHRSIPPLTGLRRAVRHPENPCRAAPRAAVPEPRGSARRTTGTLTRPRSWRRVTTAS